VNRRWSQDNRSRTVDDRSALALPLRFGLVGAVAGAVTGLCVEAITAFLLPAAGLGLLTLGRILLAAGITALLGGTVGAVAGYLCQRRLGHIVMLMDAWLRGNLALRTNTHSQDELGQIERRLNLIIEHLEEDEQDLDRLRESNTRLADQVRALAVVEERNRLARELHDTVKQHLFSLALTASAVRSHLAAMELQNIPVAPELEEMVREMEIAAQTAQRETTRLIDDLRPAPLQERGLAAALNDYTLLFGAQQHLLIYLDVRCDDARLPPLVTETLYRVAQEALHNVARHAHATRVDVSLISGEGRVTLIVEDNGVGFDPGQTREGLGISSMQERLMSVGGRLQVQSEPGTGTTIRAELEVPALAASSEAAALESGGGQPAPRTAAWGWLGQKLMIPVGQVWPWPPGEQERHLRTPLIGPGSFVLRRERRLWGLLQRYTLWSREHHASLIRLHPEHNGVSWQIGDEHWGLRRLPGRQGRAVLERNEQPLAAMQHRGHHLDPWTDVVYDECFYCLAAAGADGNPVAGEDIFILTGEAGETILTIEGMEMQLLQALPLPLVLMVAARFITEGAVAQKYAGQIATRGADAPTRAADEDANDRALRLELRQELRGLIREAARLLPPDILNKVERLAQSLYALLPQIRNIGGSDRDAYTVRQTIRDYLPTALADYQALPASFAADEPIQDGKTAREHLLHQLDLLQQAVDELSARLPHEDAQHLLSHGRFLAGKFGKGEDPVSGQNP
jgi:two-component system, NarL family, sensor histidine kinase LiaS